MSISKAKRELYSILKESDEVVGAGITEKDGIEVIVIFLSKPKSEIEIKIPAEYKGNKVTTQVRRIPKAVKA